MTREELWKLTPGELTDLGICSTCFNRENGGKLYGDNSDKLLYADRDIECFFVGNPRAAGHMCISTMEHYHVMSEAPDDLSEKNQPLCQTVHANHPGSLRLRTGVSVYHVRRSQ